MKDIFTLKEPVDLPNRVFVHLAPIPFWHALVDDGFDIGKCWDWSTLPAEYKKADGTPYHVFAGQCYVKNGKLTLERLIEVVDVV